MHHPARDSIYQAIASLRLIDPHTHINPHAPASATLADLLGYHYYTELAHSAGMPKCDIEQEDIEPRELVRRLVGNLGPISNTAQYRWLIEICRKFFGFEGDRLDESNWEEVYDAAENKMQLAQWPQMVLDQSNVEAVFLTNDFDDPLEGFDTDTYIPCLRTDDLVFHLAKYQTRQRLEACSGIALDGSLASLRDSLQQRFEHFVAAGARACAISLPPTFQPTRVSDGRAGTALNEILAKGALADESHQVALSRRVFWTLAELCDQFGLPFDLMIGVNRGVYADGVFQGQDLYDSRVSLIQYRELFNAFANVKFPISVLASVTNQELVSYAWIFPNVLTNGHWWYSNTPSFIARDAAARLEAVPCTKQIGYYSDAYKLEFVWPKFDMYRQILAGILADHFVGNCGWSEERTIELAQQVLRDNVDQIFPQPDPDRVASSTNRDAFSTIGADGSLEAEAGDSLILPPVELNELARGEAGDFSGKDVPLSQMETVIEDQAGVELGFDEEGAESFREPSEPSDFPTVVDLEKTVVDETVRSTTIFESTGAVDDAESEESELDPVPNADEIKAVDVPDVELVDRDADGGAALSAEMIEEHADPESLDVGDLLGDAESQTSESPDVRMLHGESSFMPDEESLQLEPHPTTGELMFPVEASSEDDAADVPEIPAEPSEVESTDDDPSQEEK
ncbi:MAG: glucuronate isomerase [Pirellulales bacterium]|nr:glucuronate isomerase [Pirellulales bacterium]